MNGVLLTARGLAIGHRGRPLGPPLDLDVRRGEVLCLLGPNGCGKTTLFRTLLGLLPPLAGRVHAGDLDVAHAPRERLARRMAYVPQAHAGVFAYRADDVVLMGRAARIALHALPSRADREAARAALARLGIAALADRAYTELSGGERQLVLIARALAQEAPLIVLDEPTASLDFGNQRIVLREVQALAAAGVGVLMSTHQPDHALRVAHRVALMRAGELVAIGPTRETMSVDALASLYGLPREDVEQGIAWGSQSPLTVPSILNDPP